MRSITRWTLAGLMALAALDVATPTAEAAPSVSPFAGTYVGADPANWRSSWTVTISDGGRITSSYSYSGGSKGSMSGRISADGRYSLTVSETWAGYDDGPRDPRVPRQTYSYTSVGSMARDIAGNVIGTPDTGGSFLWLRP